MTDDDALFAAALAHPDADTPRLVLADWFDDHDEVELAWALRTHGTIIPFLAELARWDRFPTSRAGEWKDGGYVNRWESQYWAELVVRYRDRFDPPPAYPAGYDPEAGWREPAPPDRPGPAEFLDQWASERRDAIEELRAHAARVAGEWPTGR